VLAAGLRELFEGTSDLGCRPVPDCRRYRTQPDQVHTLHVFLLSVQSQQGDPGLPIGHRDRGEGLSTLQPYWDR